MDEIKNIVTVACVNFAPVLGDKNATLEKMEHIIRQASQDGANIVLFPETALTGYVFPQEMLGEIAETVPGPSTERLQALAAQLGVYIVYGLVEKDEDEPTIYYNSAAIVGPASSLGSYRKVHVGADTERVWCTKGDSYPLFDTVYGPVGIGICYDNYCYPEVARTYALRGARLLLNPTAFNIFDDTTKEDMLAYYDTTLGARCIENKLFLASANLVGCEAGIEFCGRSAVFGPKTGCSHYHIWGGPAGEEEETVIATLDLSIRENLPTPTQNIFRDRRPDTYSQLCTAQRETHTNQ